MAKCLRAICAAAALIAALLAGPAAIASEDIVAALREQARAGIANGRQADPLLAALVAVYDERANSPIWLAKDRLSPRGEAVLAAVRAAGEHGLEPTQYYLDQIEAAAQGSAPVDRARLDWFVSRAMLTLAVDLSVGRVNPGQIDYNMQIEGRRTDPMKLLREGIEAPDPRAWMEAQAPATPQYAALKAALASRRAAAANARFTRIPEGSGLIKPGTRDPRVVLLRERLGEIEGLTLPPSAPEDLQLYDEPLAGTVKAYQARLGLSVDGVVGARTIESLNASSADRVGQIIVNLERRRWVPDVPGLRYVRVNIADHSMVFVDGGRTVFESRVIVGTPKDPTPEITTIMYGFRTNPYWTVPTSIAGEEYLPLLRRDPTALQKQGMKIFASWSDDYSELDPATVDWSQISPKAFPFRIRQEPGPGNALGYIFFPFANKYGIYMHDTASRWLFTEGSRNFSHGCIRLQNPLDFVEAIFKGRGGVTKERVNAVIQAQTQSNYVFPEPIPLHVVYQTVAVKADGSVEFRDDVYGRDRKVLAALRVPRS
jgi:murein L,D-transpeptidase YcbB/YkuD